MRLRGLACAVFVCGPAAWAAQREPTVAFDFWLSRAAPNESVPKELVPSDASRSQARQSPVPIDCRNLAVANDAGQGVAKDDSPMTILKLACLGGDLRACRALERSRILTNESAVLGRLVAYISAQAAYLAANRGYYTSSLQCLVTPATEGCLGPAGPSTPFIAADVASDEPAFGYRFHFQAVPAPRHAIILGASRQSASAFLVWAVPVELGRTGQRGFMMDSTGLICTSPDGSVPTADLIEGVAKPGPRCVELK